MSTPKDKAPTPVEQAPAPVVSDKEITRKATIQSDAAMAMHKDDFAAGERARGYVNGAVDVKDVYESELTKMIAERDELVEKAKEAEEYLVMALGSDAFVRTPDPIQRWIMKARALLSKYKTE